MFDMTFYKGKRVLITGHTGFKGSWLCEILLYSGVLIFIYVFPVNNKKPEKNFC